VLRPGDSRSLVTMTLRQVLIDWDWGATGIWTLSTTEERSALARPGRWASDAPPPDRHRGWRGLLSDDLIAALQAWNDHGEEVMGTHAHEHTDEERAEFWARGRDLAAQAQEQLGPGYQVACRSPKSFPA
jgi:hypothetical protein